jgi:outer membrane protein assembly factor BamA
MGQLPYFNHFIIAFWAWASQSVARFAWVWGSLGLVLAVGRVGLAQDAPGADSLDIARPVAVSDSFFIRDIHLECNHKTIDRIILRELQYRAGSRIAKQGINVELQREASKIFNTNLFVLAEVFHFPVQGDTIDLIVSVVEKWYIYPVPIFELADRNFNEWWQQRGRDLDRTVFGIRFTQQNFRGRNEDLKLTLQLGFTRKIEFEYNIPYIDRRQTVGLNFRVFYDNNKNLPYRTDNHKLSFLRMDEVLRERFSAEVGMFKRSQFYNTHFLDLRYHQQRVADTIVQLNPEYFMDGRTQFRYAELVYTFNRDIRDMAAYPLKGMLLRLTVNQKGLGAFDDLNQFSLAGLYAKFVELGKHFYYSGSLRGYASFPRRQPFVEMRTFGYQSQFPRGYDLFVIDGQHWGVWKNTGRFRLLSHNLQNDWIKLEQFRVMPVAIYLKAYADAGYVVNPLAGPDNQRLTNRTLLGTGVGLDLVLYNTSVFRFEYSVNREGDRGFYFNLMADF